jgi:hypothetical protein
MKSFNYIIGDKPGKSPVATYKGMWSRMEVDRMTKVALRELKKYKAGLLREGLKDGRESK